MKKIALLAIGMAALAAAGTKSYSFQLWEPALLGTTTLAPGHYRVEISGQEAIIRNGKFHEEAPVKVEEADTKYNITGVRLSKADGKMHIQEIHVGGTKTKLVFAE